MDQGLNSFQLKHALTQNSVTKTFFDGIYPSDYLHALEKDTQLIIVNTDPSTEPGEHWLLFYIDGKNVEMFDSLGRNPDFYSKDIVQFIERFDHVKYVTQRVQPLDSSLCGHYCLYYAYFRCLGKTMESILANVHKPKWIKCCVPILFDIPGIISECQSCKKL